MNTLTLSTSEHPTLNTGSNVGCPHCRCPSKHCVSCGFRRGISAEFLCDWLCVMFAIARDRNDALWKHSTLPRDRWPATAATVRVGRHCGHVLASPGRSVLRPPVGRSASLVFHAPLSSPRIGGGTRRSKMTAYSSGNRSTVVSTIGAKLSGGKGRQCFSAIDGSVAPEPRRHRVRLSRCSKVQSGAIRRSSAAPIHQERQVRTGVLRVAT